MTAMLNIDATCVSVVTAHTTLLLLVQDTWSHVEFKFTQHKGTDVYLVKMAEEDFEALEDNQVLVQVRSPSPMNILCTPACKLPCISCCQHSQESIASRHQFVRLYCCYAILCLPQT